MKEISLQQNHPIPLYYQLAEHMRDLIESGQLSVGERLPSVKELAAQYGISYMTARQAVGELVRQGLLEVRKGVGTFVSASKITYDFLRLTGFTEDMRERGLKTHSELLRLALELPTEHVASRLSMPLDEEVVCIARLRFGNDEPIVLDQSYLPSSLCPGLETKDLERNSLYALLENDYRLRLGHSQEWLEATGANVGEADLLKVPVGTPVILLRGVTYLLDERPIEYFKVVYRGDRFRFRVDRPRRKKED